ncbi:MFS transporter [Sphingomonas sp. BT-65]|uniref:MFS transporter n=1 Tax=Sphingomonas sp. BT-65 TaxID=2989821 RepID=UPI0022357B96|nr:MFS transporter [Sphingomonas sp. BT-65]MCW4460897.1 MFS transporter [Sphingomonas sp. BT-65]
MTVSPAPSIPLSARLGWAIGEFAIAGHMAIISIYLLYYLTDVHHFPGALAGTLIFVPRLWNVITDPLMGGLSDRVKSRWGRRRPFLFAGAILWGGAYVAMFWIPADWSLSHKAIWFLVSFLAVNTGLSLYHVPYSAMLPEMTRDASLRIKLSALKEIAARLAVLIAVLASPLIASAAPDALTGHRWVGLAAGLFIFVSGLTAFFTTAKAPSVAFQPQTLSLGEQWRTFRANRPLFRLSGAYLFACACDAFYSALMIYFLTVSLRADGRLVGAFYPIGSLTAMAMTALWAWYGVRVGRKRGAEIAFGAAAAIFCCALFLPSSNVFWMIPFMVALGAAMAGVFLFPSSIAPDAAEYDEAISGQRREGAIFGAWIFTQQTGMALGSLMTGIFLDLVGYDPTVTTAVPPHVADGIRLGFALLPAALLLIGFLFLRGVTIGGRASAVRPDIALAQPAALSAPAATTPKGAL